MTRRMTMFIAILLLAVLPLTTAHAFSHVHAQMPVDDAGLHDLSDVDGGIASGSNHSHPVDSEKSQCCTTVSHCSGFLFRSDFWKVSRVDWSVKVKMPSGERPLFGFKPEAETPPPRSY